MSQQNNQIEVRKLPKKTIILLSIMGIIMVIGFVFVQQTKSLKMEEVLATLGHDDVSGVKVVNRMTAEDKDTKVKSTLYKIMFHDNKLNKDCVGFINRSNDGKKYEKDIDCK